MDLKERGPRQRRSFDDNQEPRRSFDHGGEPRRSFDDGGSHAGRSRTAGADGAVAAGLPAGAGAAARDGCGPGRGRRVDRPDARPGYQQRQHKAFEVVRKIRSRAPDRPPGRRFG